ncbi:MAG: divalent-cation tolerance protein CutA [Acidobacteria bacterium]|nr:MAG: divalent-cation tolerance protein CutA [Acidobacteriota bacterium]
MSKPILVVTTTGSEQQALSIAEELVQNHLTASVNLVPGVRTIYRFNGKVFDDDETLLIIKTTDEKFNEVSASIERLHTYETPEILAIESSTWTEGFHHWLSSSIEVPTNEN